MKSSDTGVPFSKYVTSYISLDAIINYILNERILTNISANMTFLTFCQTVIHRLGYRPASNVIPNQMLWLGVNQSNAADIIAKYKLPLGHRSPWLLGITYETVVSLSREQCMFAPSTAHNGASNMLYTAFFIDCGVRTISMLDRLTCVTIRSPASSSSPSSLTTSAIVCDIVSRISKAAETANGINYSTRVVKFCCNPDWWICNNIALSYSADYATALIHRLKTIEISSNNPISTYIRLFASTAFGQIVKTSDGRIELRGLKRKLR